MDVLTFNWVKRFIGGFTCFEPEDQALIKDELGSTELFDADYLTTDIFKRHFRPLIFTGVLFLMSTLLSVYSVELMRTTTLKIQDYIRNGDHVSAKALIAGLTVYCAWHLVITYCNCLGEYYTARIGISCRRTLLLQVFRSALYRNSNVVNPGEMNTAVSVDLAAVEHIFAAVHFCWAAPLQSAIIFWSLYRYIGVYSFVGMGVMLVYLVSQATGLKLLQHFRKSYLKCMDERLKGLEECLLNIKMIKAMNLESHMITFIAGIRSREVKNLKRDLLLRALSIELNALFIITATTVTVLLLWYHKTTDFATILAVMALFKKLRHQLNMIPVSVAAINDGRVSTARLTRILQQSDEMDVLLTVTELADEYHVNLPEPMTLKKGQVIRSQESQVQPAHLAMALSKMVEVALCSHDPWLMNASIKDNILFGQAHNPSRYHRVIAQCQLEKDIDQLGGHDHLITGHGANLSGGQRARLALARGLYSDASVWILDNNFKSLDADTTNLLLQSCISQKPPYVTIIYFGEHELPPISCEVPEIRQSDELHSQAPDRFFKEQPLETQSKSIPLRIWGHWLSGAGGLKLLAAAVLLKAILHSGRLGNDIQLAQMSFTNTELQLYILSCAVQIVLPLFHLILFYFCGVRAATKLQSETIGRVFQSPLLTHTKASIGLLMNRVGKEQEFIDLSLPIYASALSTVFFNLLFTIYGILSKHILMAIPLSFVFILYFALASAFRTGTRSARRAESSSRSHLCDRALDLLLGHEVLRGLRRDFHIIAEVERLAIDSCGSRLLLVALQVWFTLRVKLLGHGATLAIGLISAFLRINPAMAALAFSYSVELPSMALWTVRQFAHTESHMVAYERIHDLKYIYQSEPANGERILSIEKAPSVQFKDLSLDLDGTAILKSINLNLDSGIKTAIVGRTGSGKSSLLMCLPLLYTFKGEISIGDVSISTCSRKSLRKTIGYVAQEPLTFKFTLAYNLDPEGKSSDYDLWRVMKALGIKMDLDDMLTGNESCCLKERICLARGLLRGSKLLLLDEPLASLSESSLTTILQSRAFQDLLADRTVLIVTHRQELAAFCDRIVHLADGQILAENI